MSFSKNNFFSYLYLKDQKVIIALVLLSLVCAGYLGFLTPTLIRDLYDSYQNEGSTDRAIYLLGALFIAEYCVSLMYQIAINRYVQKLLSAIRSRSYKQWILSIESGGRGGFNSQKYPMGEVLSRVLTDTEAVIEMVSTGSFKIFIDFTFIISCLIGFIELNTISGVALIIVEVLACVVLIFASKKMAIVYMEVRRSTGILSRVIANLTGGFRSTFYHPNENYASKTGYNSFEDFLKKQLKANVWDASYFSLAESLTPILLALLVIILPYSQIVEIAVIAAIVDLIQRSITPIKEAAGKISSIQRARTGIIRIEEFNSDLEKLPKNELLGKRRIVEFDKLKMIVNSFEYPARKNDKKFSLQGICIEAGVGDLIGIVGQSGCGKSTLLKILSTDIIAQEANISLLLKNGERIELRGKSFKPRELLEYKEQVSIVSQDSHVFSASMKFNITMGDKSPVGFDAFWSDVLIKIPYLKVWGIKPSDEMYPKELSLGQKQLVSALRSCYLAKPIVLFDEISSGLDSSLEEALRELVLETQKKSLTFIVAHRVETIIHASKILLMENGKIVGEGTHSKLLSSSQLYNDFISKLNKKH